MRRWYLVHTKPSGESIARANLERQGYEIYLPRLVQTVRRHHEWRERVGPLFPRYLFLHLDEGHQSLRPVHSTLGVATVVRFGTRYAVVGDQIVSELRACADRETGLHRLKPASPLLRGTPVTVLEGPLAGLRGIFEREEGNGRVLILLTLLGQETRVEVSINDVSAAACAA